MTKQEMLLNMAIDAIGWGEGADFEMTELIHEGGYSQWIRKHYPELFTKPVDKGPGWNKVCNFIQKEVIGFLRELRKPYESEEYEK